MFSIRKRKGWEIADREATPESVFMDRRRFLKGMGTLGLCAAGTLYGCDSLNPSGPPLPDPAVSLTETEQKIYPAQVNAAFHLGEALTDKNVAASFNNYYEFSQDKRRVRSLVKNFATRPWAVEVAGLVRRPQTFDVDDLLKTFAIEERVYRLRCVEAWAMVVPWTGFPLSALLERAEPKSAATHVRLVSFHRPFTARGQLAFWEPWPYSEALRIDEAMNDLTFLATGIYGRPLPRQHGAPLRLAVPWKYGFKSIKGIVRIELLDYKPATFWNTLQGLEYDFTANVDPGVPHPRWSQSTEKMIDTGEVRPTLKYNGYEKFVSPLYAARPAPGGSSKPRGKNFRRD